MTSNELKSYRNTLVKLTRRLGGESANLREEVLGDGPDHGPTTTQEQFTDDDVSREKADAEIGLAMLGNEETLLAECTAALARIDGGTFGKCATCGKEVSQGRLLAIPYARECIGCARQSQKPA